MEHMSKKVTPQQAVANYYGRVGSRLGYIIFMKRSQHFGYYDKTHTTEQAAQQNYHEKFAKFLDLKPGMRVLDAGCGQGVVACYLAKTHGVNVTGITVVPHEVTNGNRRAAKLDIKERANFILADYANPPFEPETFDRIYTTESLSHAVNVKLVLQQFMKLLKPGGKLVCAEYEGDTSKLRPEETKQAIKVVKEYGAVHGVEQFDLGRFIATIRSVGFKNVTETEWTANIMPSFERLVRIVKPFVAVVRKFHLERYFVNIAVADYYTEGVKRGAFLYKVYTATKPSTVKDTTSVIKTPR